MMGFAYNDPQIKLEQDQEQGPEVKKSNYPLDQSYIELEEFPDSFLDSLLDFDGWVEDHPNPSMADLLEEKPNLEILDRALEIKKAKQEEASGSVNFRDSSSLIAAADVIDNSEEKPNLDKSLEIEKGIETECFGSVNLEGFGSSMAADVIHKSEEKPNLENLDKSLEMEEGIEKEGFGSVNLGDIGSSMAADVTHSSEEKPNFENLDKPLEIEKGNEEGFGSVSLGDLGSSMAIDVIHNSEEKPNLENLDKPLEMEKGNEEEGFGSVSLGDLGSLIEEEMCRVSLASNTNGDSIIGDEKGVGNGDKESVQNGEVAGVEKGVKNDTEKGGEDADVLGVSESESDTEESESEEESSSLSSSSNSDDEDVDDEGSREKEMEMEEGEIRDVDVDKMIGWDGEDDVLTGPIRSKNEVQNLPPVPPVNAKIEPHHQTLPVGVVLSIIGAQVIVEGVEKHNPLSEGSILWITESRSPLGVVDEIFGPVKNPYYIVRYNSESEVPSGIQQGSLISFVPEFADYILNNNNLYKKGYDASGENDEELSDELEFSDDEKEAEYKKMLKMSKRGSSNEQKNGNMKKGKKSRNRGGNWKNNHQPSPTSQSTSGPGLSPAFSPGPQTPNFTGPPSSGAWTNGFPPVQPQNPSFLSNGFPPFMPQNFTPQPSLLNSAPFHPQFNPTGQMMPSNFVPQGCPPSFGMGPAFAPWPMNMPQNGFNQSQAGPQMAFQGLLSNTPSVNNVFQQGFMMPNGLQMQNNNNNNNMRPPMSNRFQMESKGGMRPSFGEHSRNPNRGGKKPFQRGRQQPR